MNLSKLRALIKGNKEAVTKLTSKFDDHTDIDVEEAENILQSLEEKQTIIHGLHEQVLEVLPAENEDEIAEEVITQHDYSYILQSTINKIKKNLKVKNSNLNSTAQPFPYTSSVPEITVINSPESGINQAHPPVDGGNIAAMSTDGIHHPGMNSCSFNSVNSSVFHRLPKLDLPVFTGNVLEWQAFWDSYESAIHANPSLTDVQRFNYLKSLLRGESLQTVTGFSLTNANYQKAVSLLHERYGQREKIIQTYMKALLDVPAPVNSFSSLRHFYDATETYIRGLDSLGQSESTYGSLLVPVMLNKLPAEIKKNMTREHGSSNWCLSEIRNFLLKELTIIEAGNELQNPTSYQASRELQIPTSYPATAAFVTNYKFGDRKNNHRGIPSPRSCVFCKKSHSSVDCLTVKDCDERINIVKRDKLCFNCLGKHRVVDCKSKSSCKQCSRRHHTSLCKGKSNTSENKSTDSSENKNTEKKSDTSVFHSAHTYTDGPVLLKTAITSVQSNSTSCDASILFDEGAQRSFITEKLAQRLNIVPTGTESHYLSGFGEKTRKVRHLEIATISLQTDKEDIPIKVLIVPEIAVPLKTYPGKIREIPYLHGLKLAHPLCQDESFDITLLIGADYYWQIVQDHVIRGNGPTAVQSKIGYLLSGPLHAHTESSSFHTSMMNLMTAHIKDEVDLEKFWKVESLGIDTTEQNEDYDEYMLNYQKSCVTYNADENKYHAKLPWKENHPPLPTNEYIARRRTQNVICRLQKEPMLLKTYGKIIEDQERRGFIEKVPDDVSPSGKLHYIPHHPVKKDSSTTPIRIVFDCSCRSSKESASLNACLESTPPILNDLTAILMRFRAHRYAVTTDIEKAFLNIVLDADDRDVTRFFWLSDPDDHRSALQTYRFKSVLFGATCSPFILNATILKHLSSAKCDFKEQISKDLYVDNILSSVPDKETLINFYTSSRELFQKAGFNLRSWASNEETLRDIARRDNVIDEDTTTKVLGMRWDSENDTLTFPRRTCDNSPPLPLTKRELLKQSASIYDPLGMLNPLTVRSKLLIQSLWQRKIDWDEILPEDVTKEWTHIKSDIDQGIATVRPRCYFSENNNHARVLHIFTDASMKAYGACAYITAGKESSFVMAKNRVAPIKKMTIPKLELMAAFIGAKLADHVTKSLTCTRVTLWSDSQVVLNWLTSSKQLNVFVANRIKQIHDLTSVFEWRYCPTDSNPADLLSRGVSFNKFQDSTLWMHGPEWLTAEDNYPTFNESSAMTMSFTTIESPTEIPQPTLKRTPLISNMIKIEKFSSYQRLLRVTAYVLRFTYNCRHREKRSGPPIPEELENALYIWLKDAQCTCYPDIYQNNRNDTLNRKYNVVKQLDLYLDEKKIIRCGGRIVNAPLDEKSRFPFLLPKDHRLTDLIITSAHKSMLHSGTENTVTYLRQKFWIPSIRQKVKSAIHKCITCRRVIGKPYRVPNAPPLPKDRVQGGPPFTVTGVDFSGALNTKCKDGSIGKAYICLFTCANTRAVHLEIVPDMTIDSFMLAFRRFISRKSTPKIMMSDNAPTYIAAANILKNLCTDYSITWKFIPPGAPWYGGWWERLIGLTKTCLKKVLGKSLVSIEVLQTLITEVECIINDRPLTYVSSDPLDEEPLTPSHLLYGRRVTSPTIPDDRPSSVPDEPTHESVKRLANFKSTTLQHFWTRWRNEYLTSLREYHKLHNGIPDTPSIGDVVLIQDDNTNRTKWPLAVIQDLITGGDGLVRAVRVRTKNGVTTRPIAKLYPMETRILCIQANSKASSLGGQQVLDCHLQYPQSTSVNYMVEWKKDGLKDSVLVQFRHYPPNINDLYKGRVRLVKEVSLEISHIRESDEGWYECKVMYVDGVENENNKSNGTWIYLNVNIPPKMLDYSPQSFHQPLGSNVKIFCRADGSPEPSVSWTKDDRPLRVSARVTLNKDNSEVLINNLQESDGGIYKCTFQNTVGLIAQTVHLIVEGQAYIIGPPVNRTAVLGQRIQFTCEARGYPTNITYRWYKDTRNVNTLTDFGKRITISDQDGSLIITVVSKTDMGWYLCRPSNGVGQDPEAGAYLNVTYKPEVLVNEMPRSAIWALGFKEKLDCPVDANPPAHSIIWTKNGMVLQPLTSNSTVLGNGTLVVNRVAMSHSGNYRCTAISSIGNGESEIVQVEVKDPPRFIVRPDATYVKTLGQSVTMACTAAGTPLPVITWRNKETGTLQSDGRVQQTGGNLTIHGLQKSDHGVYECEARNEVRKIVVSTLLTVQNTTPHAPYNISVQTDLFTATLMWIAAYSSTPQNFVIWYRSVINGNPSKWQTMRVEPQNASRFTIYRLEPDTLYEFKVASRNVLGSGESSTSAVVQARTQDREHSTQKSSGYVDGKVDVPPTDETGSTYFPPIVRPQGPRPTTPANVTVELRDDEILVSWDPPTATPVSIFRYLVEYNIGSGWTKTDKVKAPLTTFAFNSVESGQTYSFRVYSYGLLAFSKPSEVVSVQVPEEEGFGLSNTEIGGIIGGLLFLFVAITLAVVAVMCSRRRDRRKQHTKYGNVKYLGPQDETDARPEYPPEWSDVTQAGRRGDTMTSYHSNTLQGHDNGIFMVPRSGDLYSDMSRDFPTSRDRDNLLYHPDNSRSVPYSGNYGDSYYRNADTTYQSDRNRSLNRTTKSIPYDNDDNGFKDSVRLRNRSRSQPANRHSDGPKYPVPDRPRSRGLSLPRDVSKESGRYPPQPQVPVLRSPQYSTHAPLLSPVIPGEGHERSQPGYPGDDDEEEVFMPPPISSIIPNRPSFPRHSSMKPSAQQTYLTEDFDSPSQPFLTNDLSSVLPSPFSDSQSRRPYHPYQRQYADVSGQRVPYGSQSRLPEFSHNGSYGDMDNTVVARQPSPDRTMSRTLSNGENSSDSSGRPMNYTRDQLLGAVDQVRKGPRAARRGQQWGTGPNSVSESPSFGGHGAQFPESAKPSVIVRDRPSRGHSYEHDPFRAAGVTNSRGSVNSSGGYSGRGRAPQGLGGEQSRREDLTPDSISSGIGSRNTSSQLTGSSLHSRPSRLGSNLTPMEHDVSEDSAVPFLDYPPAHRKDVSGDENYEFDSYNAVETDLLEALRNYSEVNSGNGDLLNALQEGLTSKGLMSELYPKPSRQSRYSDSEQRFEKLRGEFQKYRQKQQQEESSRSNESQGSIQGRQWGNSQYPRHSSSTHSLRNSGNYGYPDSGSQYYGGRGDNLYKPGPMDSDML